MIFLINWLSIYYFVRLFYETHQNSIRYVLCYLWCRKTHPKGSFYAQVDTIIDWRPISAIIDKNYQKRAFHLGLKTLRWTPAFQNATHRDVEQSLGYQARRVCKWQPIGDEILRYAIGRFCTKLQCFKSISHRAYRKESLWFLCFLKPTISWKNTESSFIKA